MFCKVCLMDISPDCMLTNRQCVFCYYKIKSWDSNGKIVIKKNAIITYENFFRKNVQYYKGILKQIKRAYRSLPKGNIKERLISGRKYYYLQKRNGLKVKHFYIGKVKPNKLLEQIKQRQKLKKKIQEVSRILYILREVKRPATSFNRYSILERDKFTCQYCGRKAPVVTLEVDHIIPVSKGGTDDPSNLITACFKCNNQKRNRLAFLKHVKDE